MHTNSEDPFAVAVTKGETKLIVGHVYIFRSLLNVSTTNYYYYYRNSLLFCCENIFVPRKRTKIFYANKFYNENFYVLVVSLLHTSTSPIAAARMSLYTW